MPATIDSKFIKKQWNSTSSTGKALLKLVKTVEKAEATLAKQESAAAYAALSGALKAVGVELKKAEATYKKKKDKKMAQVAKELATEVKARTDGLKQAHRAYAGRLELWKTERQALIADIQDVKKELETAAKASDKHVVAGEKVLEEAKKTAVGSDPAGVRTLKGEIDLLEEKVAGLHVRSDKTYEALKKRILPVRAQRPESSGIDLSLKDIKPFAKLWTTVMKEQAAVGSLLADLQSDLDSIVTLQDAVKTVLSDGAERAEGFARILAKTADKTENNLKNISARLVSKYPGYRRSVEQWATELPTFVAAQDETRIAEIQKGRALIRREVKTSRKTLGKGIQVQLKALAKGRGMLDRELESSPLVSAVLERFDALAKRADELLIEADTDIEVIKTHHRKMESVLPI